MYQVSQLVAYGSHGVCRIVQMEERMVDRKMVSYYVLEPLSQPGTHFLIPTHNPIALAKIRPLMQKDQLLSMLKESTSNQAWIQDENRRKQLYRHILASCDVVALIEALRLLKAHRLIQEQAGRKIHICDENFQRDAYKVLIGEICVVLDIQEKEASSYLQQYL